MMLRIPDVLTPGQVARCRGLIEGADWLEGRATAGYMAARVKNNLQLDPAHPAAREAGDLILEALGKNPLFVSAVLPLKVLPPLFNRYEGGGNYGNHVDNAVFPVPGSGHRVRSDVSATLFLSSPDEYDGGELLVEDSYGTHGVKLPAGHMVIYPSTSLHRVTPVTRGTRLASFFWIQSMVRHDHQRTLLFDLDTAIQSLARTVPDDPALVQLTGVYHNLVRQWAET